MADRIPRRERRSERRAARRYWHKTTPWRSCNRGLRAHCLYCLWRRITGQERRALEAHRRYVREVVRPRLTTRYARQNPETGRWEIIR
jgi:hypothetical protein